MKLVYAARGPELGKRLRAAGLHDQLRTAGVRRLQLNLDDADVAPALRIATGAEHLGAVVSVWTDEADVEVTAALRGATTALEGWEVEEHRPIDPPDAEPGRRQDALAQVALLRRPDELGREEWLHRWLVGHTPVAIATQASFGYVQNVVTRPVTDPTRRVDAVVEELFPSAGMSDPHAFYGSGGDGAELRRRMEQLMASVARIGADRDLDLVPSSRYTYRL